VCCGLRRFFIQQANAAAVAGFVEHELCQFSPAAKRGFEFEHWGNVTLTGPNQAVVPATIHTLSSGSSGRSGGFSIYDLRLIEGVVGSVRLPSGHVR